MADTIIQQDSLKQAVSMMENALLDFAPYSETFVANVMENVEQNHSDFADELMKLLLIFRDKEARTTWSLVRRYYDMVKLVQETYLTAEEMITDKVKGETEG